MTRNCLTSSPRALQVPTLLDIFLLIPNFNVRVTASRNGTAVYLCPSIVLDQPENDCALNDTQRITLADGQPPIRWLQSLIGWLPAALLRLEGFKSGAKSFYAWNDSDHHRDRKIITCTLRFCCCRPNSANCKQVSSPLCLTDR
jgi:hypothetical protein